MKKYLFAFVLLSLFLITFQGVSHGITVTVSPNPATVSQSVTITAASSYSAVFGSPSCTLAVDFGDGSPWANLPVCNTVSCTRTVSHVYMTPGFYTVTVRSLAGACVTPPAPPDPATASLTVGCASLAIASPSALPQGTLNSAYSYQIQANGGMMPYAFSLTSGILPPGFGLNSTGMISGVPAASGTFNFTVSVRDSCPTGNQIQNKAFSLIVGCPPLTVTSPASLPSGISGQPFSYQIISSGGQPPVAFMTSAGALPPGLSLAPNGQISGTPTTAGTYNFTITASDSCVPLQSVLKSFSMTVTPVSCPALSITSSSVLPSGISGQPFSYQIISSGGQPPVAFMTSAGALPPGLSLAPNGQISGTPTTAGTYNFTITASDSCVPPQSVLKSFSMTVAPASCPALNITSSSVLPPGTAAQPYTYQFQTTGGQPPVTFTLTSGRLPPGLSLAPSGRLAGAPGDAGTYNFTISAVDNCATGSQQVRMNFSMTVCGDCRVIVSPVSSNIPRNMPWTQNIVYSFSDTSTAPITLSSTRGIFTANNTVIGETSTPLTATVISGIARISESLSVPAAISRRAEAEGTSRIIYTRTFTGGATSVTAQMEFISGTEAISEFSIQRLQLYFENGRAETTLKRNQSGLKAFADIRFTGSGLLKGYWEVDGRILEYVNQHLVYGATITIATPDVPPLPTYAPGTHIVRFVVTQPSADIPMPQAIYFVTPEDAREVKTIDLIFPEDQSKIDYQPVSLEWEHVTWAESYLVVFLVKPDEKPVFSAYTRESRYRLPPLVLGTLFAPEGIYYWQVKGYDAEGNIIGESDMYRFVFMK